MTSAITVKDLHVEYKGKQGLVHALRGVSFEINAGECVAIIGRSGSGKTSLLRALSGQLRPASGTIEIAGHELGPKIGPRREFCRDVGLVFQDYGLVPQLSALQNVLCGRLFSYSSQSALVQFTREDRGKAGALLTDFGLGERIHTRSDLLSGGEQQRVGLARLLLQAPGVMLLDEPMASLDVHWAEHTIQRLRQVRDNQGTVVMVLHDLTMARKYADRVLVIQDGSIVFDGAPEEGCLCLEMVRPNESEPLTVNPTPPNATLEPRDPAQAPPQSTLDGPVPETRPGLIGRASFYVLLIAAIIATYIWSAMGVNFSATRVFGNLDNATNFLGRMLPPDFSVTSTVAGSLVETIQMALIGTTLAAMLSLPIAMLAARNISPRPFQMVARLLLNLLRTIPSIIWGLFFVAIVGLGPFPGILALTFYASGYLGKFYYEGIEAIDPKPVLALKTVGASPLQRFRYGVFPQVLPLLMGYTLYMFEYNVRAASILGVVGAGGIGFYLYTYINNFHYNKAATALVLLLVVVTVIDVASSRLRAHLST